MNKKCSALSILMCISLCFITSGCGWNTSFLGKAVAEIEHMVSDEATDDMVKKSDEVKEQSTDKQVSPVKRDVLAQANEVLQSKMRFINCLPFPSLMKTDFSVWI